MAACRTIGVVASASVGVLKGDRFPTVAGCFLGQSFVDLDGAGRFSTLARL